MIRKQGQLLSLMAFLISLHTVAFAQMRTVKGIIIDEMMAPMPGISVATEDRQYTTFTDSTGHYSLQVPVSCDTLRVRMIGMKPELIPLMTTLTTANRILFSDNEEGYTYPPRTVRKLQRQEARRRAALYKKAEKQFFK